MSLAQTTERNHVEAVLDLLGQFAGSQDSLSVASGDTFTVASGDTERFTDVSTAGTLSNAGTVDSGFEWQTDAPEVKHYLDDTQQERGQGADQPPKLYVWEPTSTSTEKFSLDGEQFDRSDTVEILAYSLTERDVIKLQSDVQTILSNYINDNKQDTEFTEIEPTSAADYREQTPRRNTQNFVAGVTVETRHLPETALA